VIGKSEPYRFMAGSDVPIEVKEQISPRPVRRYRTLVFQGILLALILLFALLAVLASIDAYFPFDPVITRALQSLGSPFMDALMNFVSWFGFGTQSTILALMTAAALYGLKLRKEALVILVAVIGSTLLNLLVKIVVQRPRPSADIIKVFQNLTSYSFPSGHVMFYTAFFGFLFFLAFTLLKPSWLRTLLLILTGGMVLLIGPSRIYLGAHWPSDVLGAYMLGGLVLLGSIRLYQRLAIPAHTSRGKHTDPDLKS
jgi:membrane-associated phospholipid phosphatase